MPVVRILLCLFIFAGAQATAERLMLGTLLVLRFPPLLLAVVLPAGSWAA